MLLRSAYLQEEERSLKDAFQIAIKSSLRQGELISQVVLSCSVYYGSKALNLGGNILESILEKSNQAITYLGKNLVSSDEGLMVLEDESKIDSLEKYFYWNCQNLLANNIEENLPRISSLPVFNGTNAEKALTVTAIIDFDLEHFLLFDNLVESVGVKAQPTTTEPLSLVGDSILFGNNFLVGN